MNFNFEAAHLVSVHYAWHQSAKAKPARALQWWLDALKSPATRTALLERHRGV